MYKSPSINKQAINTMVSSNNRSMQKALGVGAPKQSQFMQNINKPLIENQTKQDLIDFLLTIVSHERQIEQAKIKLAQHTDFNLIDAFKIFDTMARGSLTIEELHHGLANALAIIPNQDEIKLFFMRYDKDRDARLRFSEFCEAFTPATRNF